MLVFSPLKRNNRFLSKLYFGEKSGRNWSFGQGKGKRKKNFSVPLPLHFRIHLFVDVEGK